MVEKVKIIFRKIFKMSENLKRKILSKKAKVAVIGLGYVGLPLAFHFAKKGFQVFGLDTDRDRVERVRRRKTYITDIASRDLRQISSKKLQASTDFYHLEEVDVVVICVPTPLKRKYTPDISYILKAITTVRKHLQKGQLIILESTTYPGTTEELLKTELEKSGLSAGRDFFLAFSPERIDPGNKKFPLPKIPKIVGGLDAKSGELAKIFYEQIISHVHLVSSAKAAEMTKLLENSFRIVNIGWINEAAMICHKLGIDVWEVIEAAKTKPFGFMPFYPGLGVGGHCIPDDPLYLYWKAKHQGFSSKFIKLSADINFKMPAYVVGRLREIFKKSGTNISKARILVVGVTYKRDVKDLRKSPPLKLIELLQAAHAEVAYHDPLIPYLNINSLNLKSVPLTQGQLSSFDCVVIATDHSSLDYGLIKNASNLIFDTRHIFSGVKSKKIINL